jgi:predicted nucleotidyltransferase
LRQIVRSFMRNLNDIEEILKKNKPVLEEKHKVRSIGIFGSYVHGEQSEISDVDILVSFRESVGWEVLDLKEFLESILGVPVDLVTINALKPQIKDKILDEVVYT